MDPQILQLAMARPEDEEGEGRPRRRGASDAVLAKARAASAVARKRASATPIDPEAARVTALCLPGAAPMLGIAPARGDLPMKEVCRLAVSPKIRGSGPMVEKVRRLQNLSTTIMARCALDVQKAGLARLQAASCGHLDHRVLGCSIMWDEASQKARALLTKVASRASPSAPAGSAPLDVQVMISLGAVQVLSAIIDEHGVAQRKMMWQPWVMPPLFLTKTSMPFIMEGACRTWPIDLCSEASVAQWTPDDKTVCLVTLCFDFASSNVSTLKCLVAASADSDRPVLLHGERCATHCVHLVKAHCIATSQLAGVLYSISKLMKTNRVADGLSSTFREHVRVRLEVRLGQPPELDSLIAATRQVLGIDGDFSLLEAGGAAPQLIAWFRSVMDMLEKCPFDRSTGKWLHYSVEPTHAGRLVAAERAIGEMSDALVRVFVTKRWETAALSRWTGVMNCLKRMALGILMNGALASCLGSLRQRLGATEEQLQHELKKNAARAASGEDVDDTVATNLSRILRVSVFFSDPTRKWQVGVTLISVAVVDKLHWDILGAQGRKRKATLAEMAGPSGNVVASAQAKFVALLDGWSEAGAWSLLEWFALPSWTDEQSRRWARNVLLRLSAGTFDRTEKRFSVWPYKLYLLVAHGISPEDKRSIVSDLLVAPSCCLGPFATAFRASFGDPESALGPKAESVLLQCAAQQQFSTAPVECEHKQIKEELASTTAGQAHAPAALRAVCRHLHSAHMHRGGQDISLPLRRRQKLADASVQGRSWPQGALEGDMKAPLLDAAADGGSAIAAEGPPELGEVNQIAQLKLGGGNPKVMYVNYNMHLAKVGRSQGMTREDVRALRPELVQRYDHSVDLQTRWRHIFGLVFSQKKAAKQLPVQLPQTPSSKMWPGDMQPIADEEATPLPIGERQLVEHCAAAFPSQAALEASSKDRRLTNSPRHDIFPCLHIHASPEISSTRVEFPGRASRLGEPITCTLILGKICQRVCW